MVLEDDENLREILVGHLEDHDYLCEGASSAAEAVVKSEAIPFDIVIADVRMAGEMDGLGALTLLKHRRPELKCIVMTGYADDDAPLRALAIDVNDYLYKPFEPKEMVRSIEQIRNAGVRRSVFVSLWDRFFQRPRVERALERLSEARVAAANQLRVAVRSRLINQERAWELWQQWEGIEKDFARIDLGEAETSAKVLENGVKQYHAFCQGFRERTITRQTTGEAECSRDHFRPFYRKLHAGEIDVEELLMAVFVRRIPETRRRLEPELQSLNQKLWT